MQWADPVPADAIGGAPQTAVEAQQPSVRRIQDVERGQGFLGIDAADLVPAPAAVAAASEVVIARQPDFAQMMRDPEKRAAREAPARSRRRFRPQEPRRGES